MINSFALILCLSLAVISFQAKCLIYVDPNHGTDAHDCGLVEAPCLTLYAAVDLAERSNSTECDIFLAQGIYEAPKDTDVVVQDKDFNFIGASSITTHIKGVGTFNGFKLSSKKPHTTTFTGITMSNFAATFTDGPCISVTGQMSVSISNCNFQDNRIMRQAGYGGAIYFNSEGELNIAATNFQNNTSTADGYGGAIAVVEKAATVSISDSYFKSNFASFGGAVYVRAKKFYALRTNDGEYSNTWFDNKAHQGGAIYTNMHTNGHFIVTNATFSHNVADGTYYIGGDDHAGGALYITETSKTDDAEGTISNTIFIANDSAGDGGSVAINLAGGAPSFINCQFDINHAKKKGGAIILVNPESAKKQPRINFDQSIFTSNYVSSMDGEGSTVYCNNTNADFNHAHISVGKDAADAYVCNGCNTCEHSTCTTCDDCGSSLCIEGSNDMSCSCYATEFASSSSSSSSSFSSSDTSQSKSESHSSDTESKTSSSESNTSTASSSSSSSGGSGHGVAIGFGIAAAVILVIAVAVAVFFYLRKRNAMERAPLLEQNEAL